MTVEGLNLAKTSAIYFSEPGVTGRILRVKELPDLPDIRLGSNGTLSTIDLGPLPPRNQVTIEVDVAPEAEIGPVAFRLQTPLGTSPEGRFLVEPYYGENSRQGTERHRRECRRNDSPTILTGVISKPGDVDYYKIHVKAGEQLVFENGAMSIGSSLQPVVAILAEDDSIVKEYGTDGDSTRNASHTSSTRPERITSACVGFSKQRARGQFLSHQSRKVSAGDGRISVGCRSSAKPAEIASRRLQSECCKDPHFRLRRARLARHAGSLDPAIRSTKLSSPSGREPEVESNGRRTEVPSRRRPSRFR